MKSIVLVLLLVMAPPLLTAANAQELLIFYSNDVHGETEPCG